MDIDRCIYKIIAMDIRTTCESDLDYSKSSLSSPSKLGTHFPSQNMEEMKNVYRKRKKIVAQLTGIRPIVLRNDPEGDTTYKVKCKDIVANSIFCNYKTPKKKFVPTHRPNKSKIIFEI